MLIGPNINKSFSKATVTCHVRAERSVKHEGKSNRRELQVNLTRRLVVSAVEIIVLMVAFATKK